MRQVSREHFCKTTVGALGQLVWLTTLMCLHLRPKRLVVYKWPCSFKIKGSIINVGALLNKNKKARLAPNPVYIEGYTLIYPLKTEQLRNSKTHTMCCLRVVQNNSGGPRSISIIQLRDREALGMMQRMVQIWMNLVLWDCSKARALQKSKVPKSP